jgi:hypothetical protein
VGDQRECCAQAAHILADLEVFRSALSTRTCHAKKRNGVKRIEGTADAMATSKHSLVADVVSYPYEFLVSKETAQQDDLLPWPGKKSDADNGF